MGNVLSPFSDFSLQGGYPQGTDPETYGTIPPAPEGFYVSNSIGSDSNDGLSPSTPFLTIQKATDVASTPGDIVNIMAGTYKETSTVVGYVGTPLSVAALFSGTLANPIIFRAHLGDEGLAIIDSEMLRVGFNFNSKDYVQLINMKLINNKLSGVVNWNKAISGVPLGRYFSEQSSTDYSTGLLVRGNYVDNTDGTAGENIASYSLNCTVDSTFKNNYGGVVLEDGAVTQLDHTSSLLAFHVKNMLVENNHLVGGTTPLLWKDHWLEDNDDAVFESEIRYNLIESSKVGIGNITGNTEPGGSVNIHHNIIIADAKIYGANSIAAETGLPGGYVTLENNTFIVTNNGYSNTVSIDLDVGTSYTCKGNIVLGYLGASSLTRSNGDRTDLISVDDVDYNVYDDNFFKFTLGLNGSNQIGITPLTAWQATLAASNVQLSQDNPDTNAIESNSLTLFEDASTGDYRNKLGSPAIGLMLDGSNAGAYQLDTEVIGRTGGGAT